MDWQVLLGMLLQLVSIAYAAVLVFGCIWLLWWAIRKMLGED